LFFLNEKFTIRFGFSCGENIVKNETRIGAEVCSINLEAIGMVDGAEVPLQLSSNDGGEKEKIFFFFF
jgi:hypothetical protein